MFLTRSEYDRGVNTFSPEGRLFQVEYAIEAIKLGSTAIGIQTSEGVCLAVEKRITSPLMEPSSIEKIVEIDSHIGCAMSGLIADAKTLIDKARVETQNHWFTYNETMTVESVTQAVSNLALQFGEEDADPGAMSRPFGVALLFGGVDEKGPQLFHMDPSGTFVQCDARAIGSASEGAQSSLQEVYHKVKGWVGADISQATEVPHDLHFFPRSDSQDSSCPIEEVCELVRVGLGPWQLIL
ncbi:proteasome subunit alpha type-5 isoform X2 [Falco cherrug]|uniref:proteasome subunit alpha type-5 isoform X2 n=1 Tax=Falco cherrug TaxID=345164 RepID=UPI00247A8419|nr:proteasome subunit alpha type-5 isoform X2 [Falco cherrug]